MARPVSWLPRLAEIRRSVAGSVRTHYDRRALEKLFQMQPRASGKLMAMLRRGAPLGTSHLVEREVLLRFLDAVTEAEDTTGALAQQKAENGALTRRKPRTLVRREFEEIDPASLAPWLERGVLKETRFASAQQLADILWRIACAVQGDGLEAFCKLYEPEQPESDERQRGREEFHTIQAEIEAMRARRRRKPPESEAPEIGYPAQPAVRDLA
jgi:hypothetical protein